MKEFLGEKSRIFHFLRLEKQEVAQLVEDKHRNIFQRNQSSTQNTYLMYTEQSSTHTK